MTDARCGDDKDARWKVWNEMWFIGACAMYRFYCPMYIRLFTMHCCFFDTWPYGFGTP